MDSKGTYHLNDNKMDTSTVWQWRILCVKKYSRHPEPFHYSNEIGLDFNIACNTQKKMDLQLLTNGVILEVSDFAKSVSKNKRHVITDILENNFSLGLENEQQRSSFTAQILHKVNDLIRNPPEDKHEVFTLFDVSCKPGSVKNSNNVQKMLSTECETKSFLVEMDDTDDSEHEDELNCSAATSNEYIKTESLSDEMDRAHSGDGEQCSGVQSKKELKDASFPPSFPHCEEIGLNLDVDSKQSLDPSLLTKGVMLEVVHFTGVLAASYSRIILDVLEHNFELDLKNQLVRNQVLFNISQLLKRRKQLTAIGSKITPKFKNEPFSFQTFAKHHDKRGLCTSEEQIQTPQILPKKADMKQNEMEAESIYSCAPVKSDLDPYDGTDSRNTGNEDHSEHRESCSVSSDFPKSESSCLDTHDTFLASNNVSSIFPTVNSDVNSPFTSQHDERGLCGDGEQTSSPQNVLNKWDMKQEEMGTENNLWKLRSNRVEQIVSPLNKEFCFTWSKKLGLEFNVGFGPKQNISVDSLSSTVLLKIAKFAIAINSSQKEFIMEILEYNFDFGLQSPNQRNIFTHEIMKRVRQLRCCEDAVKFSNEVFELPGPSPSINMTNQSEGNVIPQLSSDVSFSSSVDSHGASKEPNPHKSVDLYPFCKEIGLKLRVNNSQPNRKLEINVLTNGAMTEVTNFAEKLCGTFEEIFLDILRHNFDLDLQSGDSDPAKNILARIPALVEQKNLSASYANGRGGKQVGVSSVDFKNNPNLESCSPGSSQVAVMDQNEASSTDIGHKKEISLKLWKVRAKQIQHILSMPHEENCPLYSYSRCKQLGIDFNVGSGVKQNLDPKFLTNGIIAELNAFVVALLSSTKYFITEILEFNFNLDLKDELYRIAFAQEIMTRLKAIRKCKKGRETLWKIPFQLPDMRCIQEPSFDRTAYCSRCYQERNHKPGQDESDVGHVNPCLQSMTDTVSADVSYTAKKPAKGTSSTFSATEETIMNSNLRCKKIGLTLCVDKDQPTDKLDTHFLTCGVMMEVESFVKSLCGTKFNILRDLLEHNFNISLEHTRFIDFCKMRRRVMAEEDGGLAYFDEVFVFQPSSQREPGYVGRMRAAALAVQRNNWRETIQKRKLALQTKRKTSTLPNHNVPSECDMQQAEMRPENYYTCPLGESDVESDEVTDSENTGNEDHSEHPESCSVSSDLPKSESSCLGMHNAFLISTDVSSSSPTVNSDVNSPFTSQCDERGLCGGGEQTSSPQNVLNKWDTEQEEMGTEINMWKLRSNRVEQIVSPLNKEFGPFHMSKRVGLEFNVGFGPKQNISIDSLNNTVLLKIAKFAIAINSSQKEFIMEILEYNFDFSLQSPNQRNIFTHEIMKRVRQLRCCEDAVKFSNEVFELPGPSPSINMTNQSEGNVIPQLSSVSRMEKCDVGFSSSANSHGESKEPIPHKSVDLYPFCKEIGLNLHVNNSQPNRKLEINALTNGAMTEVTNFAEKLCGTFEEIFLDILRHNVNLDLQSGDSDPAKNILAQIPALVEQKNLSASCAKRKNGKRKGHMNLNFKNNPNLEPCSPDSSQAAVMDQNEGSSTDIEHKKDINLKLWKVRAKQIQHILSMPHEENCPLYSYSRCKKNGIDFNVGSGVKQNLDPKFLTNGIIAELNAFVVALLSSTKYFLTEILEFNFNLDLKDELHRIAFAQDVMTRLKSIQRCKKGSETLWKIPFELPDMSCIQEPSFDGTTYCPRCYQERNHKPGQDESDAGHVNPCLQSMTDTVSADGSYTAKTPAKDTSSTFSATEEMIMNSNPHCKKIGLTLCVDKDQPTDKLDTHFLTRGVMMEVENFAKKLCGTRFNILSDLLEHNFNISVEHTRHIDFGKMHCRVMAEEDGGLAYFDEVFVFLPSSQREPGRVNQIRAAALAVQRNDWRETIQKRKIALQTKEERATLPSPNKSVIKSKKNHGNKKNLYPICTEIGLDLDVTSQSEEKIKLDLNLLTAAVLYEIHKFVTKKRTGHYFPDALFDILDYNFDLSSQHHRRWEFAIATAFKVQNTVKRYCQNREQADEVFKLPFVFEEERYKKRTRYSCKESGKYIWPQRELYLYSNEVTDSRNAGCQDHLQNPTSSDIPRESNSSCQVICASLPTTAHIFLALPTENSNVNPLFESQSDERGLCGGEEQTRIPRNVPIEWNMDQEEMRPENYYICPLGDSDLDSDQDTVLGSIGNEDHYKNPESSLSSEFPKSESRCLGLHDTFLASTDVSSSVPTVNSDVNSPSTSQRDARGLCGGGEQTPSPQNVLNKCDMEQEEMRTENYSTCNIGESDKDSDKGADSQSTGNEDHLENPANFSLSSEIPPFARQLDKKGLCRSGEQTQIPRNALNECDLEQEGCQNNPHLELCSAGSSQATIINQNIGSSVDNELNLKLWKLRTSRIQQILSVPHEDDCPLNSYSRCKKLGIDFNVGSGVKQNLDPKFLTNGIMVELNTFASALLSSRKYFITEILEHNFNLDFKNELYRSAFAHETMKNIIALRNSKKSFTGVRLKLPFELPDMRSIQEATYEKTAYCLRCYQDRNRKLHQNESDTAHVNPSPHTMTDTVSADVSYTAKKPAKDTSSTFSATEEMIMNSNPHCKKIGLTLCVDTDQPKNKLDTHVLTRGIILEVANFAKKLCGTNHKVINNVLEHNFNIMMQSPDLNPSLLFKTMIRSIDGGLTWLDEVFVIQPRSCRSPGYVGRMRAAALAIQRNGWRETIQKRKLALQTKRKRATLPGPNESVVKSNKNNGSKGNLYDEDSDKCTDSENTGNEDHSEHPESCSVSSDFPKSESSCLSTHNTFFTSNVSSSSPTVNSDVNSPFTSQRDERGLCGGGEQTPSPQNVLNKWDTEQEEMGTEINMWKLRSNRVEQIVFPLNKEFGPFHVSTRLGLEFNVGFGPKQNISIDSLSNTVLLEIAKFVIAINSSQKEFIMEILEYNFDFGLQSSDQRNTFTHEIMKRVRQLRCCEDAVKFSNEVFELPGPSPSINMTNQSEGNVIPQVSSNIGFSSSVDSHGESKEPIPHKSVDLYPFCKEIDLKLRVNNSQPNRKLEIVLTNGAMTEVTNFAEKLCGTFEEIFLEILRHNFDLDLQSGDSDPAKNILARIPALVEQKNLSASCANGRGGKKGALASLDFKNNPNLEPCSPGSSQAAIMDQNVGSSTDIEHKKEISLKLWKVRTKQIQHILSMPHEENCPLYSYSRCKKLGIDFNVGSGVKQNLDPKFLTNGIMAELSAFVVALLSSTKYFITEILEFNFNLDLKDELHRIAFAQGIMTRLKAVRKCKKGRETPWKIPFQLPDMRCIQEPSFDRTTYCPRCYQERNHKIGQGESDAVHVHPCLQSMTDTVSADVSYTAKTPAKDISYTFSAAEEMIMNSKPHCKKIGLTLCVDKDQPTDKPDTHFLTCGVMMEVESFAKKLCGSRYKILRDLLEHNFNISMEPNRFIDFGKMHCRVMAEEDGGLAYFDEVFVFHSSSQREPGRVSQVRAAALAVQRSDWRETIQKRQIALQTKEERATLPNPNISVVKSKKNHGVKRNLYPICTEIGLDLDVTSQSEDKEKLDLNVLTAAALYEIHKFVTKRIGHYFPGDLFDILDYNFDLSSQHHRRLEFSIATASKVLSMVRQYRQRRYRADKVFKLPFVFERRASQSSVQKKGSMKRKRSSQDEPGKKRKTGRSLHQVFDPRASQSSVQKEGGMKRKRSSQDQPGKKRKTGRSLHQVSCSLDVNPFNFLRGHEPNREPLSHDEDTNYLTDPSMINAQSNQSPATVENGSPLPINIVIKEEGYDPHYPVMKAEPVAEEKCHPHNYNVKTESNSGDVGDLVPGESAGCTSISMCPNTENVKTESENEGVQYYILAEPHGSQGHAMLAVCSNSLLAQYWVSGEVAASYGDSMIPVCQNNESTLIKEEQENMLIDSYN